MSVWNTYPPDYRESEVLYITAAVQAGECVSVVGLSGAGKSNLMGYLAHRSRWAGRFVLVDCNRLRTPAPEAFFLLIHRALGRREPAPDAYEALEDIVAAQLDEFPEGLCLLLDRFDALVDGATAHITSNLRALRDAFKYQLTFVTGTRRPLNPHTELSELVYANTLWLGPLSKSDTDWNVFRYAKRKSLDWDDTTAQKIHTLSRGYPALLRAVSEAHSLGCPLELPALRAHPAVVRRVEEFWIDKPTEDMVAQSRLTDHPLLKASPAPFKFDAMQFTAKEQLLLEYLLEHVNQICDKDVLVRAVWPEDIIYEQGVRDDSLAQLVRRLRKKIEPDPSHPQHIETVPGRGYVFREKK